MKDDNAPDDYTIFDILLISKGWCGRLGPFSMGS
jgi:hypothetical protein